LSFNLKGQENFIAILRPLNLYLDNDIRGKTSCKIGLMKNHKKLVSIDLISTKIIKNINEIWIWEKNKK